MVGATLINMNPVEFKYYSAMISLNKCTGNFDVLSSKICVPKETKYINVKTINMILSKGKAKAITEQISCDYKCKFNSTICNSNQKCNNKTRQCECKNYRVCKKDYSWNPSSCISENSKYLKSTADTSVTKCDEITFIMDIVPTRKTNVTNTASINCHSKKVRDGYILHTVSIVIILLLIITIICYHYAKQIGK